MAKMTVYHGGYTAVEHPQIRMNGWILLLSVEMERLMDMIL